MAKPAKPKAGNKKKAKKAESRSLVVTAPKSSSGSRKKAGVRDLAGLLEHPLVTELLAVGAMAAVSAIAEHVRQSEMPGQGLGDGALAACSRSVDGNDDGWLGDISVAHRPGALTGRNAYGKAPADCRRHQPWRRMN